ncbi:MAG: hypothetical protein AAGI45_11060 [Cyanobacteria bacterium P01_H01_bin.26]
MSEANNRLDRIEQLLVQTAEIAAENTRALQLQRTINADYDRQSRERMDNLMEVVQQSAAHQDQVNDEISRSIQTLIDEGKADRAEAQRQRTAFTEESERQRVAFTEAFQQLLGQLVAKLNSIGDRIEQIWNRINAA